MYSRQVLKAQLRGVGSAALTGILISMLATTQMFAQSATLAPTQSGKTTLTTVPQGAQMSTEGVADGEASSSSLVADANLPAAPAPVAAADPAPDPLGQQAAKSLTSNNDHKVKRPGQLAVGIIGAGIFGFGTYVTAKASKDQGLAALLFMTPGAVMMGFGFTLAFKPKNQ